jgi:hypothetical protein
MKKINRYKQAIKKLRHLQGARDAEIGKIPQSSSPTYLRGYSEQYAKEAMATARTEQIYF